MTTEISYEENDNKGEPVKVQCEECKHPTNHEIVLSYTQVGSKSYGERDLEWRNAYQVIRCKGCDSISFRNVSSSSEDCDVDSDGEVFNPERQILYPKRSNNTLPIKSFLNLPYNLVRIYRETIQCFNDDSFTLASSGLRSLVEGLCAELGIAKGTVVKINHDGTSTSYVSKNLDGKIYGLYANDYLTKTNAEGLHELRFLGNKAVHELEQPPRAELKLAIEIIEDTFKTVFQLPQNASELKLKRERREKKRQATAKPAIPE